MSSQHAALLQTELASAMVLRPVFEQLCIHEVAGSGELHYSYTDESNEKGTKTIKFTIKALRNEVVHARNICDGVESFFSYPPSVVVERVLPALLDEFRREIGRFMNDAALWAAEFVRVRNADRANRADPAMVAKWTNTILYIGLPYHFLHKKNNKNLTQELQSKHANAPQKVQCKLRAMERSKTQNDHAKAQPLTDAEAASMAGFVNVPTKHKMTIRDIGRHLDLFSKIRGSRRRDRQQLLVHAQPGEMLVFFQDQGPTLEFSTPQEGFSTIAGFRCLRRARHVPEAMEWVCDKFPFLLYKARKHKTALTPYYVAAFPARTVYEDDDTATYCMFQTWRDTSRRLQIALNDALNDDQPETPENKDMAELRQESFNDHQEWEEDRAERWAESTLRAERVARAHPLPGTHAGGHEVRKRKNKYLKHGAPDESDHEGIVFDEYDE